MITKDYSDKPKKYQHQATIEAINEGMPYYIASPTYGYEGVAVPIAGTILTRPSVDKDTGKIGDRRSNHNSLWVTTAAHRHQHNDTFHRASLSDDGVMHQIYSDRLAFTNIFAAIDYAKTGKVQSI